MIMKNKILTVTLLACISFVCLSLTTKFQTEQDSNWEVPEAYTTMKNPYVNTIDTENVGRTLFLKNCKLCLVVRLAATKKGHCCITTVPF